MEKTKGGKRKRGTPIKEEATAAVQETIYVCSIEYKREKVAYVVHAIRVSDLLSDCSSTDSEFPFRQVAYKTGENLMDYVGCGILGTRILFAGGLKRKSYQTDGPMTRQGSELEASRKIYVFETSDTTTTTTVDEALTERIENFQTGKSEPWLQEVDGKLYALPSTLNHLSEDPSFEVFDSSVGKWSTLPKPPFIGGSLAFFDPFAPFYSYAVLTNNILFSSPNIPYIFSFDCSNPQSQWEITDSPTFKGLPCPLPFFGKALTVVDDDDCLMFTYRVNRYSPPIVVYQMLNGHMHIIKALDLPNHQWPDGLPTPLQYSFVNLGNRKVCLFMACYMDSDSCDWMPETETGFMRFFVVTLEFSNKRDRDIHSDSESELDVAILNTRIFDSKPRPEDKEDATSDVMLLGCFLPHCYENFLKQKRETGGSRGHLFKS